MRPLPALVVAIVSLASVAHAISVEKLLGGGRLVAYAPSGYDPAATTRLSAKELRADAESLRRCGFRAIATYGASRPLVPVCRFFKRHGFRTVLVGIWDPRDAKEMRRAIRLARCADGYVVGNEGLAFGRYTREELAPAIARVRRATGRPVTTRETLASYAQDPGLLRLGDWVFPTIHPWYAGHTDPQDACGWTIRQYRDLAMRAPAGVPVVVGETGLPTEGAPATSEHYQRAFVLCLESRQVAFAHFEAFDQPWKREDAVGPHWGLFHADGTPKLWAAQQLHPALTLRTTRSSAHGRVAHVPLRGYSVVVYSKATRWEPSGPVRIDRRGKWRVRVPAGRPVVAFLVAATWAPTDAVDRLPAVDRVRVVARRDGTPM